MLTGTQNIIIISYIKLYHASSSFLLSTAVHIISRDTQRGGGDMAFRPFFQEQKKFECFKCIYQGALTILFKLHYFTTIYQF